MATIYNIRFRYSEEYKKNEPEHNARVCVYEVGTPSGDTLEHAFECANEDDDWTPVDNLLSKMFGLKDDDINFYYDISDIEGGATNRALAVVPELQKEFGIVITDIKVEDVYD